jgi:D-alanyl-D-alanine carboxypeptidase
MLWVLLIAAVTSGVPDRDRAGKPTLRSESVLIRLADTGEVLIEKNADVVRPIASITKLLSALTMKPHLDPFDAVVTISDSDKDKLKWSKSRLVVGLKPHVMSYSARGFAHPTTAPCMHWFVRWVLIAAISRT